jgi:hypothetical protein
VTKTPGRTASRATANESGFAGSWSMKPRLNTPAICPISIEAHDGGMARIDKRAARGPAKPGDPAEPRRPDARTQLMRIERQTIQCIEVELRRTLKGLLVETVDQVVATVLETLTAQLSTMVTGLVQKLVVPPAPARTRLGRSKRCRVCGLHGTRNDKRIGDAHSREDHERWRADRPQRTLSALASDSSVRAA